MTSRPAKNQASPSRIKVWRQHHLNARKTSLDLMFKHPMELFFTLLVLSLSALPASSLWLMQHNINLMSQNWNPSGEISVFLKDDTAQSHAEALLGQLREADWIESGRLASPDETRDEYLELSGIDQNALDLRQPLFPYIIHLQADESFSHQDMASLESTWLNQFPAISSLYYDQTWTTQLLLLEQFIWRLFLITLIFSAIGMVFIISNTMHLRINQQQEEIAVLHTLGAQTNYIKRPYRYFSVWIGISSGLLSWLLLACSWWIVSPPIQSFWQSISGQPLNLQGLLNPLSFMLPIIISMIAAAGTEISCYKALKK